MLRDRRPSRCRKGTVLLAVLVVVVILSLAVYQYSELTLSEYKSADQSQRQVQALALAESGVHYAAALLSSADSMASSLSNNPYHNPGMFTKIQVPFDDRGGFKGTFSLLAPPDPQAGDGAIRFGAIDESGKINLNSLLALDRAAKGSQPGQLAVSVLQALPNMTADIAASIVDWLDADTTPLPGGAEDEYYSALNPPYRCKNGPLDSLEELLLVKGVTPELLFGQSRNPYRLAGGSNDNASTDLGWSAYLTVHSREQTVDLSGNPLINLNSDDLATLSQNLQPLVGSSMTNFIILCRLYGSSTIRKSSEGSGGETAKTQDKSATVPMDPAEYTPDLTQKPKKQIKSLFDLLNAQVTVPADESEQGKDSGSGGGKGKGTSKGSGGKGDGSGSGEGDEKSKDVVFASPLNNANVLTQLFPVLYNSTFTESPLSPMGTDNPTDIPARININTAPQEVLQALVNLPNKQGNPSGLLTDLDVQAIVAARPSLSSDQPFPETFRTPLWLITQANLDPKKLSKLNPYITTRSQVYRVHVQGTLDAQGPSARVDAVIDTNGGQPRILWRRNLTELGKR